MARFRILAVCTVVAAAAAGAVDGPLRVLESNPRYLTDGSGKVVLLVGSHDWNIFQDYRGPGDCDRDRVNHKTFLSNLVDWGHSFTRGWYWESAHYAPLPYRQACGDGRYVLEPPLNPAYLGRLKHRIRAADRAGLYTSVMLFQGWSVNYEDRRRPHPWPDSHPYYRNNNCSGSKATNGPRTQELDRPAVRRLQEAYVREMVRQFNRFDNIIWEISNESHLESRDWQIRMLEQIRDEQAALPNQHPIWISCFDDTSDLFLTPAEIISPCRSQRYTARRRLTNPPENRGEKVIIADSDHLQPTSANDVWAWKSFMRGLQPIFMDQGNYPDWTCDWNKDHPEWQEVRNALGTMLALSREIDLAVMAPQPQYTATPSSAAYALFSTDEPWSLDPSPNGGEFLVYFEGSKQQIDLCELVPGRDYEYQWTKALDAGVRSKVVKFRQQAMSDCRSFTNQADFSRALRVSSALKPPTAVIRTEPQGPSGAAPLTVEFDGSGSSDPDGTITTWEWSFPTGGAVGATARYVFDTPGRHPVTLKVTDNDGLTGAARLTVEVSDQN